MIEKWRQAKIGDEGFIARFRYGCDGHWRIGTLEKIRTENDTIQVTEFYNGFDWFLHCEVLIAYLDDTEITSLSKGMARRLGDYTTLYIEPIKEHYEK